MEEVKGLMEEARAISKYNRMSMKKVHATAKAIKDIRNKRNLPISYLEAAGILLNYPSKSAAIIFNTLRDAYHNLASNREDVTEEDVYVKNIIVSEGPTMKRIKPRARGRADRISKRMCHVRVEVGLFKALKEANKKIKNESKKEVE